MILKSVRVRQFGACGALFTLAHPLGLALRQDHTKPARPATIFHSVVQISSARLELNLRCGISLRLVAARLDLKLSSDEPTR